MAHSDRAPSNRATLSSTLTAYRSRSGREATSLHQFQSSSSAIPVRGGRPFTTQRTLLVMAECQHLMFHWVEFRDQHCTFIPFHGVCCAATVSTPLVFTSQIPSSGHMGRAGLVQVMPGSLPQLGRTGRDNEIMDTRCGQQQLQNMSRPQGLKGKLWDRVKGPSK